MHPRTQNILQAVIAEFVETGEPVSSGQLYKKYQFGVMPATIRNELSLLDEADFLAQPYTSSGRVPTDKAYAYFAEATLHELLDEVGRAHSARIEALRQLLYGGALDTVVERLADKLHAVGVGYDTTGTVKKSGLHALIEDLVAHRDISDVREVGEIVSDFEMLDRRVGDLPHLLKGDEPRVFIGKSPITRSPHLSVIADRFTVGGAPIMLAAIGSKRMDYEGNIRFFIHLQHEH